MQDTKFRSKFYVLDWTSKLPNKKDDTLESQASENKISVKILAKKTFGHILEN